MKSEVVMSGSSLQITRVFEAPRETVFGWWSRAEKLQQWSGCQDSVSCEIEMDFRVGGSFTQKMQIGDKGSFTFTATYDEIVAPEKISYHADLGMLTTRVRIEFFAEGDRTKVVLTQDGFPDETMCNIISKGTLESMDKLDLVLAGQATASA